MKIKEAVDDFKTEITSYGIIMVLIGAIINITLRLINNFFSIGLWLDNTGTLITAVLSGPWTALLTALTSSLILSAVNPSAIAYVFIGASIGLILGYMHKTNRVLSKTSTLLELLGLSFLLGIVSTMIYCLITVILIGSNNSLIGWIVMLLLGTSNGLTNGVLTGLAGAEMLAQLLDKTIIVLLAYFSIRWVPNEYFKNKTTRTLIKRVKRKKIVKRARRNR